MHLFLSLQIYIVKLISWGKKKGGFVYLLFWVDSILLGHTDSMAKASTVNSCPAGTEARRPLQGVLLNLVS